MSFPSIARRTRTGLTLTALVALVALNAGCGSRDSGSTADHSGTATDSTAMSGSNEAATSGAAGTQASQSSSSSSSSEAAAAGPGVVRLIDKGCVQFDPMWVSVAPGQAVTWVNETKAAVTIHVDAGAFAKAEFVVQPGERVTSGPAGPAKDYKVTCEPNACQGPPLGARGSGPGVGVESTPAH